MSTQSSDLERLLTSIDLEVERHETRLASLQRAHMPSWLIQSVQATLSCLHTNRRLTQRRLSLVRAA